MGNKQCVDAIAYFEPSRTSHISGSLILHQCRKKETLMKLSLSDLKPHTKHAVHIHEKGNLSQGCSLSGSHYNPFHKLHGCSNIDGKNVHVGDIVPTGSVESDGNGIVELQWYNSLVSLFPPFSVIGRSVVIHEKEDDCGIGQDREMDMTGNAGEKISCSVIGIM